MKKISIIFLISVFSLKSADAQKVGLVLSGGGVRALCHIGVIKALEENHIPIDYISGTSMGALVGSMYVLGLSPAQMEQVVLSSDFSNQGKGIITDDYSWYFLQNDPSASWVGVKFGFDSVLRARLPESVIRTAPVDFSLMETTAAGIAKAGYNFDSLFIPFRCVAADIKSKKPVIFSNGDLGQAVRASMSFPFYFPPLVTDNKVMFDGGIYNNFPVNVMKQNFNPEFTIGVYAGSQDGVVIENNILSQVKTMLVQQQDVKMLDSNDVLLMPSVTDFSLFDFTTAKASIDSGYNQTMRAMELIKQRVQRRVDKEDLQNGRAKFFQNQTVVKVDKVVVTGVKAAPQQYFKQIIKPEEGPMYLSMLKKGFFRLSEDPNIQSVNPKLVFNPETHLYDLHLEVKREKDLQVNVGANFSNKPINMGYIGLQKNWLARQSYSLRSNFYFGKLYNSAHVDLRMDVPGKFPFFVEPEFNINRYNYFKSSSEFLEDTKPSYLIIDDSRSALYIGIPARNRGKLLANGALFKIVENYYQTREFSQADTSDRTKFAGFTYGLTFERSSLNYLMYPNKGSFFGIYASAVEGTETTTLGSTSPVRDTIEDFHHWLQLKMVWDNYFLKLGPLKVGLYTELMFSNQPFFSNYTASILIAPGFEPTPESKTLFLDKFHAHNYLGAGLKTDLEIITNLDFRIEGYVFQPFNEILKGDDGFSATYGDPLSKRYFIATTAIVYHTPVGPASLSFNYYYDKFEKPYSIMFQLGFIIFNKRTL